MLRPLGKRILVQPMAAATHTAGGLYLPPVSHGTESIQQGTVRAVGPEITDIKEGDEVLFNQYQGFKVNVANEPHLLLKEDDVIGVVE